MNRNGQIAGGLVLLVIIGVMLINPASAQPIKAPAKITTPGVYELSEDARGITDIYGISIECSNVVLDGGNHFIGGEGREKSIGVFVNQYGGSITNITVKNLLLEKWETGINYEYVKGDEGDVNLITGCDIVDSETAIHVESSDYVQVFDNKITGCPTGINIEGESTYTTLEKNTIKDSGLGVGVMNSRYTTIEDNNINTCSVYGIQVTDSEYTTITKNGIGDNKYAAVMIENSRESDISGNTLTKTETGPVLSIGNEVRYASVTNNYFGSYEAVVVDEVSSEIAWNSTQAPGTNILGGPYMGGNYWGSAPGAKGYSDTAPDEDGFGIADKPFQINEYNIDYLPLTHTTATKAPEDQIEPPVTDDNETSSINQTTDSGTASANQTGDGGASSVSQTTDNETPSVNQTGEATVPAQESGPVTVSPSSGPSSTISPNNTSVTDNAADILVENSTEQQPVPGRQNLTPALGNNSIMNSSLTNAYAAEGSGDLPVIGPATDGVSAQNPVSEQTPAAPANETAPAQVGYLAFNVSQPGYQVTLTTATGKEVSLDQAEGNALTVPVPVQGLVYTSYQVTCNGFVPVSGNISPYPGSGQTVTIPVTLVPAIVQPSLPRAEPVVQDTGAPVIQPVASQVRIPENNTPGMTVQAVAPVVPAQVNESSVSPPVPGPVPVVITNGVVSKNNLKPAHMIKAFSSPGGSIFPAGDVEVLYGESVTFMFEPQDGHQVSYLVIDGIQTGPMSEYRFIDVTANHTIAVGFT